MLNDAFFLLIQRQFCHYYRSDVTAERELGRKISVFLATRVCAIEFFGLRSWTLSTIAGCRSCEHCSSAEC